MTTTKLEEAGLALRRAEDAIKTSLFKWKPDYEIAALEFEKAGNLFKQRDGSFIIILLRLPFHYFIKITIHYHWD